MCKCFVVFYVASETDSSLGPGCWRRVCVEELMGRRWIGLSMLSNSSD